MKHDNKDIWVVKKVVIKYIYLYVKSVYHNCWMQFSFFFFKLCVCICTCALCRSQLVVLIKKSDKFTPSNKHHTITLSIHHTGTHQDHIEHTSHRDSQKITLSVHHTGTNQDVDHACQYVSLQSVSADVLSQVLGKLDLDLQRFPVLLWCCMHTHTQSHDKFTVT